MAKYPLVDPDLILETPALHWRHVYDDLITIESLDTSMDNYNDGSNVTAFVECFTRADDCYHWEVHQGDNTVRGWMDTLQEAQRDCESNFDKLRGA